ncbi:protein FAM110D isoform X2 [Chamaea fasciata]|uniref:protein FAM110D isoform X2 n=1 Tax=Chamaea fasciata TaxID=190680 RepID=UPI00336A78D7
MVPLGSPALAVCASSNLRLMAPGRGSPLAWLNRGPECPQGPGGSGGRRASAVERLEADKAKNGTAWPGTRRTPRAPGWCGASSRDPSETDPPARPPPGRWARHPEPPRAPRPPCCGRPPRRRRRGRREVTAAGTAAASPPCPAAPRSSPALAPGRSRWLCACRCRCRSRSGSSTTAGWTGRWWSCWAGNASGRRAGTAPRPRAPAPASPSPGGPRGAARGTRGRARRSRTPGWAPPCRWWSATPASSSGSTAAREPGRLPRSPRCERGQPGRDGDTRAAPAGWMWPLALAGLLAPTARVRWGCRRLGEPPAPRAERGGGT